MFFIKVVSHTLLLSLHLVTNYAECIASTIQPDNNKTQFKGAIRKLKGIKSFPENFAKKNFIKIMRIYQCFSCEFCIIHGMKLLW